MCNWLHYTHIFRYFAQPYNTYELKSEMKSSVNEQNAHAKSHKYGINVFAPRNLFDSDARWAA